MTQNLIPNAGFEHNNGCPKHTSHSATLAKGWRNPTNGSPDYYHICGSEKYTTPKNQYDIKKPYGGIAYVGLNNRGLFREYISIRLTKTLKKGTTYRAKIHVIATDHFHHLTSDISFFFSSEYVVQKTTGRLLNCEPQIVNPEDNFIPDNKWIEISGEFIAKGGERFVTIGSFRPKVNFQKIIKNPKYIRNSYIYIDNISTIALKRPKGKLPPKGKLITLESIYFEHDKYVLNKDSFKELNELVAKLTERKSVRIEIIGHTDISGIEEHNISLSKQRALAVVNYLIKKGISKDRLRHKGLGSSVPTEPKDTKEKQAINRRVEFRVID